MIIYYLTERGDRGVHPLVTLRIIMTFRVILTPGERKGNGKGSLCRSVLAFWNALNQPQEIPQSWAQLQP